MFCVSSYWEVKLNISHVALFSQELPYSQKNGQFPVRTAMFKKNFASISGKEGSVVNEILHVYIMPLTDVQGFSRNLGSLLPGCTLVLNYPTNCQTASLPWKRPMHSYYPSSYFIDKHTKIKYPPGLMNSLVNTWGQTAREADLGATISAPLVLSTSLSLSFAFVSSLCLQKLDKWVGYDLTWWRMSRKKGWKYDENNDNTNNNQHLLTASCVPGAVLLCAHILWAWNIYVV